MHTLNLKYFYTFGIFLLLLDFSYAKESKGQYNTSSKISILIENAEQDNAMVLIDQFKSAFLPHSFGYATDVLIQPPPL